MGRGRIGEDHLDHQLRTAIWRFRQERRLLDHRHFFRRSVDRCGRREDEIADVALDRRLDEIAGPRRIVEVVGKRIGNRIRDHH
jgi:hypothetical protein